MLKPHVPKFRPDISARLKDIAEKQVPAKIKPIFPIGRRDMQYKLLTLFENERRSLWLGLRSACHRD